jgi:hypothetical protein
VKPRDGIVHLPVWKSGAWKLASSKGKNGLSYCLERRRRQQVLGKLDSSHGNRDERLSSYHDENRVDTRKERSVSAVGVVVVVEYRVRVVVTDCKVRCAEWTVYDSNSTWNYAGQKCCAYECSTKAGYRSSAILSGEYKLFDPRELLLLFIRIKS